MAQTATRPLTFNASHDTTELNTSDLWEKLCGFIVLHDAIVRMARLQQLWYISSLGLSNWLNIEMERNVNHLHSEKATLFDIELTSFIIKFFMIHIHKTQLISPRISWVSTHQCSGLGWKSCRCPDQNFEKFKHYFVKKCVKSSWSWPKIASLGLTDQP